MSEPVKVSEIQEFQSWQKQAERAVAEFIAKDPHGPFPAIRSRVRCFLRDGQVIDGTVIDVWLDLDIVRLDLIAKSARGIFRITPSEGDTWEPA